MFAAAALVLDASSAASAPFAYVTNAFGPSVSVIDTSTNMVTTTINFPAGRVPFAVAMTPNLKKVYVTTDDATSSCGTAEVFVIDTATNTTGPNPIVVPCEPTGLAITPDGSHAYVASRFGRTLSVIDTGTDTVSASIPLASGHMLRAVAITPDGRHAYTTDETMNSVLVVDTGNNTLLGVPIAVGSAPQGLAISPDGKRVYVANNSTPANAVSVIDTATNTVVTTITAGNYPSAVALTPDGKFAYVTNGGINNGVFTVSVVDTASMAVVGSPITVGSFPNAIAITADGKQAYVANEGSGLSTVSVIDTATNTVTSTVPGMNSPRGVAARPLPPGIPVPNVVGEAQGVATSAISAAGLALGTVTMQSSTTITPGIIMSQNPPAGTLEGSGAMVNLVVSIGVAVPNVVGEAQSAATSAITGAGLALGSVMKQSSSQVAPGNVISQSPLEGTDVAGGSAVNLVVSTGVAVPSVVGETQAAATGAITGVGLTLGTVTQQSSGTVAAGDVISESPGAGTNVAGNTSVNLVVSTGSAGGGGGGGSGGGGTIDWLTLAGLLCSIFFALRRALGLDLRR